MSHSKNTSPAYPHEPHWARHLRTHSLPPHEGHRLRHLWWHKERRKVRDALRRQEEPEPTRAHNLTV